MTTAVVVGIDAGASKTRAFAVDRDGAVVGRGAGGGANLLSSPDPAGSIGAALAESLAGGRADAVVLSCAGGDREADRVRGREILTRLVGPDTRVEVTGDGIAALYAGNPAGCGVVLISGTGSIAFGRNEEGEERRSGGWGYLIGDEGSAVWLGLEGLRAAAHHADVEARGRSGRLRGALGTGHVRHQRRARYRSCGVARTRSLARDPWSRASSASRAARCTSRVAPLSHCPRWSGRCAASCSRCCRARPSRP
ncbi:MAG: hypothetical protein E6I64_07075 [Chloroflexi bacterium]|nr:MAG: hypothetical protein E6I64_07075 [Chloroflexota bacterium]